MWGLGINITHIPQQSAAYWWVHGVLIGSALAVTLLLGGPLFKNTYKAIKKWKVTVEALFLLSFLGAFAGSLISSIQGEGDVYYEVVAIVFLIYNVGQLLNRVSRKKALEETDKLRITFNQAHVLDSEGHALAVALKDVTLEDTLVVSPGDAITVDGVITSGSGFIRETALTGEPTPVVKNPSDTVLAGTYSVDGTFTIRPTKLLGERMLDSILETVEQAKQTPSNLQEQADKLMQWFLPIVVTLCLSTFFAWNLFIPWPQALFHSMAVLLVACPCALGLATPIAIWSGLWKLSTLGIVSRRGVLIDALAKANRIIFDKTGTLSEDELLLVDWAFHDAFLSQKDILKQAVCSLETRNKHPIAKAFVRHIETLPPIPSAVRIEASKLVVGKGIEGRVTLPGNKSKELLIGNLTLMPEHTYLGFEALMAKSNFKSTKKIIYILVDGQVAALALFEEKLREGTIDVLKAIHQLGIRINILTGDPNPQWETLEGVKVDYGLSSTEKEEHIRNWQSAGEHLIYVGDGINDAAAMSLCKGSIAMGAGAKLTQTTSTAVLMGDTLTSIPEAIELCRTIYSKIRGNLVFAVSYNMLGMGLAAAGILNPIVAALIMLISSLFVSIRALLSAKIKA